MGAYKKIKVDGRSIDLHRYVWEQVHGPVPDGYVVHHDNHDKQDNRIENLMLMTHEEHARHHNDRHPRTKVCVVCKKEFTPEATKRARAKTCSRECFRTLMSLQKVAVNPMRKINREDYPAIRERVVAGERRGDLAIELGVSPATMTRITKGLPTTRSQGRHRGVAVRTQPTVIVLPSRREWTCPHCFELHLLDHDLDDLCNLECRNCGRVTLGRLL